MLVIRSGGLLAPAFPLAVGYRDGPFYRVRKLRIALFHRRKKFAFMGPQNASPGFGYLCPVLTKCLNWLGNTTTV